MSGKQAIENKVDALFAEWDKPNSPGCTLGIVRDGELIYERGYGLASLEFGVPITPQSVFYIASVSKQFTAASILLLAQKGSLSLDDDVRQYMPELPEYDSPITIRHLVHHTSGIRDSLTLMAMAGWNLESRYDNQDVIEFIARQKALNNEPGAAYLYSNSGYILMAEIVRRVSGQSLREFAQVHIFEPLGMTNTSFDDDRTAVVPNRVTGYGPKENGDFRRYVKNEEAVGDGGILTTIGDLYRWDQNFYDPKMGGDDFIKKMLEQGKLNNSSVLDYAFGLVHGTYRGLKTVGHGGNFIGFRSQILRFPEQAFTVICLSNLDNFQPLPLVQQVTDLYLSAVLAPKSVSKTENIQLSEEALQGKTGVYQNTNSGLAVEVFVQDGQLMSVAFGGTDALLPISQARFQFAGSPTRVEFERPTEDQPKRMRLHFEGQAPEALEAIEVISLTADQLTEYAGSYFSAELQATYKLVVEDDRLHVHWKGLPESALKASSRDVFQHPAAIFSFMRDEQDVITGVVVNAWQARNITFVRREK